MFASGACDYDGVMESQQPFGVLLRKRRATRGYTQERLACDAAASTRHLQLP